MARRPTPEKEVGGAGGTTPRGYMDMGFLRPLYESGAPVASVHMDTSRDTTDADKKIELRWRHLREELAALGTDETTLDVLEQAVGEGSSRSYGDHGQALFASEGNLLGAHTLSEAPVQDRASYLPIPDVLPLAVDRGRRLPYVLVALDRVNAKVTAYASHPTAEPVLEADSTGESLRNIDGLGGRGGRGRRNNPGGPGADSQAAQELWRENTAKVAEHVRSAARKVGAELIIVGGDEEAIAYLRDNLGPRQLTTPIRIVPGGRGGTDAEERLHKAAEDALREFVVERHDAFLDDYQRKLAHDQAVRGTTPLLPMLSEARVETLLLGAERDGEPELWGSFTEPLLVDTDPKGLDDPNGAFRAPASALMLRSAVMADAAFTELLDHGRTSAESGATLRFPKQ